MLQIIFEFIDGPFDGKVLQGPAMETNEAARYYLLTNHGKIGQRFKVVSDFAVEQLTKERNPEELRTFRHHHYVVSDRLEEGEELLIRATYEHIEPESGKPGKTTSDDEAEDLIEPPDARTRHLDQMLSFVRRAAQGMSASYGHCWPASSGQRVEPNLTLHLAHVLLSRDFAVFAEAAHPDERSPSIPLVGVSPNQDWFIACDLRGFQEHNALSEMSASIESVRGFWLGPRLAIASCSEHILRVAQYCQHGYAMTAGLHWSNSTHSPLLQFWRAPAEDNTEKQQFISKLDRLSTVWPEPLLVYSDPIRGVCHLLSVLFPIDHDSTASDT